jgi:hypothetical protein
MQQQLGERHTTHRVSILDGHVTHIDEHVRHNKESSWFIAVAVFTMGVDGVEFATETALKPHTCGD